MSLRSSSAGRNSPRCAIDATLHPAAGITPKGFFPCEARCMCAAGTDTVWVSERPGFITIRNARTGEVHSTIQPANPIFATCMTSTAKGEVWVGTNDGRICIFNIETLELVSELRSPETERAGEIHCIGTEGTFVFIGSASCRVSQWHTFTKEFVRSYIHKAAVSSLVLKGGVCYACDADGYVVSWDTHTGERAGECKCDGAITCMIMEPTTSTLWCSIFDGRLCIINVLSNFEIKEVTRSGAKGRINSLVAVGGKVWGAGIEKITYVWHAQTHKLLGKTKDHSAFIFQLCKTYTMETARLWSLSNDKTVRVYDAEGFFSPVTSHGTASEEVTAAQAQAQQLRLQISFLERKLSLEEDKVMHRDLEVEKLKDEVHKQMLKTHALEHLLEQKDNTIYGTRAERSMLLDETTKLQTQIAELQSKLNAAEQAQTVLRGDVVKAEEIATQARIESKEKASSVAVTETECKAVLHDKERLTERLRAKEAELEKLTSELKAARDDAIVKGMEVQRRLRENENLAARSKDLEAEVTDGENKYRAAEEARRRLDDQLIIRDNEIKQLLSQLQNYAAARTAQACTIDELATEKDTVRATAQSFEDDLLLKTHENDVIKAERERLERQLHHEKQQVHEARNNEQRLQLQNEELKRQLEREKTTIRMLEDQYTIFQFVINSRGELVNALWVLHTIVTTALKSLRNLDSGIQQLDPTKDKLTLCREWKLTIVDRCKASFDAAADVQKRVDYIISNYLSEYEKMHLGIPVTKFAPDASRPSVVGEQLLTKLRDVTLMKQVAAPIDANKSLRLPPPSGSTLSAAHFGSSKKPGASLAGRSTHVDNSTRGEPSATFLAGHSVRPLQ